MAPGDGSMPSGSRETWECDGRAAGGSFPWEVAAPVGQPLESQGRNDGLGAPGRGLGKSEIHTG